MKDQSKTKKQLISELAGLRQRTAELEASETERKRAEEALRESEEKFRSLAEYSPNMIFIKKRGRVVYANRKCEEMMGYTTGEFYSEDFDFLALIAPDQREAVKASFGKHVKGEDVEPYEYALVTKDGRRIEAILTTKLIDYEGERAILGTVTAITERKRAEEALQERVKELTCLYAVSRDIQEDLSIDELCRRAVEHLVPAMQFPAITVPLIEMNGKRFTSENYTEGLPHRLSAEIRMEGEVCGHLWVYYAEERPFLIPHEQNLINGVAEALSTWLEHKRAREALRRRAEELAALQATVLDITTPHDLPILLQTIVERAARLLDTPSGGMYLCDPDRREARCVVSHNTPEDYTGTVLEYGEGAAGTVAETGEPLIIDDYRAWSGRAAAYEEERPFTAVLSAPMIWRGQVTGVIHVMHDRERRRFTQADLELLSLLANHAAVGIENTRLYEQAQQEITERKQAEKALRENEEKHRTLFETMTQGVVYQAADGPIISANPAAERILGLTLDQMQGRTSVDPRWKAIREDGSDFPGDTHPAMVALKTGREVRNVVMGVFSPSKEEYTWININAVPQFKSGEENPYQVYTTFEDITERKQAEEALRFTQFAVDCTSDAAFWMGPDARFIYVNDAACRSLGYSREELLTMTVHDIDPGFPPEVWPDHWREVKEHGSFAIESHHRTKDGQVFPVEITVNFVEFEGNEYNCAFAHDITERKQAEEALRESEERSRTIVESIPAGMHMYQLEPDGRLVFTGANPAADNILGVDNTQFVGKTIEQAFPALTETEVPEMYRLAASRGEDWHTDQIIYEENQIVGAFEVQAFQTSPGRMVAAFFDITERKQAEEALRQSEERYRQLFEAESDAIFLIENESGRILEANGAASVMYGYTREELLTKRNTDLSAEPADTRQVTQETPVIVDQVVTIPLRLHRKKDGTVFPVEITGRFFTWQGRSVHIAAIRDITERKQAEEERERLLAQIQEQAQRVQQIIDTVPEGVLLLDEGERVVLANPVSEGHLSLLADVTVGDTLTHLGGRPLAELLTSPPRGLWHEVPTGSYSFQVIARPIEAGPAPGGWVLVIRDVTQQREIEQRIQQQERLASVGQLAAGIAHDFNNIMATIVLYAQMTARMENLPTAIRERMETINQQAGHAANLIQQILDFSRRAVLDRHPLDLALVLREHVKLLGRTLPESIQVELNYEPDKRAVPLIVNADPTRMQQMVTNLALNARDAMPEGGTLRISLKQIKVRPGESPLLPEMAAGEWAQVTVSDTGTGIPPDVLPHIFEPFFTTRAPLGSGLGLAQVHGIVGQHGGRIDVDTLVGEGTTFTIYLPMHLAEPSTAASAEGLPALPTGQGEIILIAEDDAVVRKALLDSLEGLNYTVLEAVNGQEALTLLEQYGDDVALVLSDVVMPGMGGIALLHALRERELTVPVVMLTGHPLERELEDLRAQGIIDWLSKPPQLEDLAVVLARALVKD